MLNLVIKFEDYHFRKNHRVHPADAFAHHRPTAPVTRLRGSQFRLRLGQPLGQEKHPPPVAG